MEIQNSNVMRLSELQQQLELAQHKLDYLKLSFTRKYTANKTRD